MPSTANPASRFTSMQRKPPDKDGKDAVGSRLPDQMQQAWAAVAYFCSGALAINASQLLATPLSAINPALYASWMSRTKGSFSVLMTSLTQLWAPTVLHVSGDASMRGQLVATAGGDGDGLLCAFTDRLVLMANHQIYTDWLYLWWVAWAAGRHGDVHIVLKDSLRRIPVLGWGMQLNRFVFLKRDWASDRAALAGHMRRLAALRGPMWLMLFPEGTNLAASTREKSARWAASQGVRDTRHVLLPRSRGLHLMLQHLGGPGAGPGAVEWLYDCTLAYEGVPAGRYAHDVYPLPAAYLEGRPPRAVAMHWRRFRVASIPLHDERSFELWLLARWREKDALLAHRLRTGAFPADAGVELGPGGQFLRGAGTVEVRVETRRWQDFLLLFGPVAVLAALLFLLYAAVPAELADAVGAQMALLLGERQAGALKEGRKLLAFDGAGWKKVDSQGGSAAKPRTVVATKTIRPNSTTNKPVHVKDEPGKAMLGFSNGQFKKVGPAAKAAPKAQEPKTATPSPRIGSQKKQVNGQTSQAAKIVGTGKTSKGINVPSRRPTQPAGKATNKPKNVIT